MLSILRKILAIHMIERIQGKLEIEYHYHRQHIEQEEVKLNMSSLKILAENYETTILLLDMSKALTLFKENLMELFETILDLDETHIMKIILKDVKLSVKIGKEFGEKITTNIGVPQGDCMSPILFTLYLADALKTERSKSRKNTTTANTNE